MPPNPPVPVPRFTFEITLPVADFHTEWKRCNMLANYLAEYAAYQFNQHERAENIISIIANELLEASVNLAPLDSTLHLRCLHSATGLEIETVHPLRPEISQTFLAFLQELNSPHSDQLYFNLLTSTISPVNYFNQLGLAILRHDFGASLNSTPQQNPDQTITRVFIPNQELAV